IVFNKKASTYKGLAFVYINQEKPGDALNVYREAVATNPDFAYLYRDIAWLMKRKNMTADVETLYRMASDIGTQKASYYEDLGYDLNVSQKYDSAVQTYQKALELDDKKGFTYKRLAFVHIKQGKPGEAVNVYRKAAKADPDNAYIYKDIAKEMKRKGMENKLGDLYRAASEIEVKDYKYYLEIGKECARRELVDIAAESFKKAIALNPNLLQAKAYLAEQELVRGNFSGAQTLVNELLENKKLPPNKKPAMRFLLITSLVFQQKETEAKVELKKLNRLYKSIPARKYSGQNWDYEIIKTFIENNKRLKEAETKLLLAVIDRLESPYLSSTSRTIVPRK
ncbi:MAG: tetratricopeptide repeat protein, partial [bacterium]|nr:tetratricopeptide repeat protein [bacterium]